MTDYPDGKIINDSFSTCAPHVRASLVRVLIYDRTYRGMVLLQFGIVGLWLLVAAGAVLGFATGHWGWGTLAALVALLPIKLVWLLISMIPNALGQPRQMFENALLTPGLVVALDPLRIVCLANLSNGTGAICYGLRTLTRVRLPGQTPSLGLVIPCVSTFLPGNHAERWATFQPQPIAWGTGDPEEIAQCLDRLDQGEVDLLKRIAKDPLPASDEGLLVLDTHGTVIERDPP